MLLALLPSCMLLRFGCDCDCGMRPVLHRVPARKTAAEDDADPLDLSGGSAPWLAAAAPVGARGLSGGA